MSLDSEIQELKSINNNRPNSILRNRKTNLDSAISSDSELSDAEDEVGSFETLQSLMEEEEGGNFSFPPSYIVLRLAHNIHHQALEFLVKKLTGKKQENGAELLVRCEPFQSGKNEEIVLHLTASKLKFLEVAEYMEVKKVDIDGVLREFTVSDLDAFLWGDVHLENLLSSAEKQMIVAHELENLRVQSNETFLPGYPQLRLYTGQSLYAVYVQRELITASYALHHKTELKNLGAKWYWALFQAQPFEEIRKYFGEGIALYFSFLGFYTMSLCVPALLGLLHLFLPESASSKASVFFCIFNLLWVTVFLEVWKRKCSELAYMWGTLRMTKWEEPRSNHHGKMVIDPVTGRYAPKYAAWKTMLKAYGVSLPIVFICLLGAFYIMLYSFWAEEMLIESKHRYGSQVAGFLVLLPSIVYSVLVWFMNFYYRKLATQLTEWENHRTQTQYERHRVTKLVLFEFVNNFMSLFYISFYIQDFEMLKQQVIVMLIIMQAINHFQEAILPLIMNRAFSRMNTYLSQPFRRFSNSDTAITTKEENFISNTSKVGLISLEPSDPRIHASKKEGMLDPYEGTFDDYLEMFIQFGYVFLFSSVYPLAAVWALLNNIFEIRTDAFKLCKVLQRPFGKRVKDIGAWQIAFEVMGSMAVVTNCALLCLQPDLRSASSLSAAEWLLLFVVIEHGLLAAKAIIGQLIPDVPNNVKIALARLEYTSRQALKNERIFKSRRQLTRRFKTIHIGNKNDGGNEEIVLRRAKVKQVKHE